VIGDDEPVPMTAVLITELAPPVITNNTINAGAFSLSWNPVTGAQSYRVYACDTPFGDYQLLGTTVDHWWTDTQAHDSRFYKVVAVDLRSDI
jgi:fibronectin type 3 domain-containing protein